MKYIWIILMAVGCGSASQAQEPAQITNEQLVEMQKDTTVQLVDVRTPEEVAAGIIAGAQHMDIYDPSFASKLEALDKERPVVVYCAAGGRSAKASAQLQAMGFNKVYDLTAGYRGWIAAGMPIKQIE